MFKALALFTTVLSLTIAPCALADPAPPIAADDPCGDNHGYTFYDDNSQDLPPTERTPRYDFKRIELAQTAQGVRVTFRSCAPIGQSDGLRGFRALYANLPGGCSLGIGAEEPVVPGQPRTVRFFKSCYQEPSGPTADTPLADYTDERFAVTLPAAALRVDGDVMTIDVDRTGLTGEAAQTLAPGAAWAGVGAISTEGQTLMGFGFSWSETETHEWGWSAPTAWDAVYTKATFTLG